MLTWISGDGKRRPEVTSSRGRSLALGDRLAVSLATAKRLPSAKDSFLSPSKRTSKSSALARFTKAFSDRGSNAVACLFGSSVFKPSPLEPYAGELARAVLRGES